MQTSTYQQEPHDYPYGGVMGESTGGDVQRYKYNGKELDRMHGLDWYDYGARHYDATIVSWPTMDPLAEEYYSLSPYAYCGGVHHMYVKFEKAGIPVSRWPKFYIYNVPSKEKIQYTDACNSVRRVKVLSYWELLQ